MTQVWRKKVMKNKQRNKTEQSSGYLVIVKNFVKSLTKKASTYSQVARQRRHNVTLSPHKLFILLLYWIKLVKMNGIMIIIVSLKVSRLKYYVLSIFEITSMWLLKETRKVIGNIFVSLNTKLRSWNIDTDPTCCFLHSFLHAFLLIKKHRAHKLP